MVYLSDPLIAPLIRYITGAIIRITIANIITTIIRTGTGTGAITVIGTTTMMTIRPQRFLERMEDLPITRQVLSVSIIEAKEPAALADQTHQGMLLARTLIEAQRKAKIIIPGLPVVERLCAEVVSRAQRRLYRRPFHTKVINATVRDATHVLDGLLYHESDLKSHRRYWALRRFAPTKST